MLKSKTVNVLERLVYLFGPVKEGSLLTTIVYQQGCTRQTNWFNQAGDGISFTLWNITTI